MSVKVVRGSVTTNSLNYALGAETIVAGDLIRISASGTIVLPEATSAGAVHGIALAGSAAYTAGDKFPVALFNSETILAISTEAGNAPEDYTVGVSYGLIVTSGAQTLDLSETSGVMIVEGVMSDDQSFNPDVDDTEDGTQSVYVRLAQATLDGRAAA